MRRDEQLDALELEISRLRMANDSMQEERKCLQEELATLHKAFNVAQHFYDLNEKCPLCIYMGPVGGEMKLYSACSMHRRISELEEQIRKSKGERNE